MVEEGGDASERQVAALQGSYVAPSGSREVPGAGRRVLPSGRPALEPLELDGLRRLMDERRREQLGFGVRGGPRLRELICELLAERPRTHHDLMAELRVSGSMIRGALRKLQLEGKVEVEVLASRRGSVWSFTTDADL